VICMLCGKDMGDGPICPCCRWRRLIVGKTDGSSCWMLIWHRGSGSWRQVPDGALAVFGGVQEGFMAAGGVGGGGGAV